MMDRGGMMAGERPEVPGTRTGGPGGTDGPGGRFLMRCTRCDGLVVPQAVGIDPEGKVVFGWCLQCLADHRCKLVETSPLGPWNLAPPAGSGHAPAAGR